MSAARCSPKPCIKVFWKVTFWEVREIVWWGKVFVLYLANPGLAYGPREMSEPGVRSKHHCVVPKLNKTTTKITFGELK